MEQIELNDIKKATDNNDNNNHSSIDINDKDKSIDNKDKITPENNNDNNNNNKNKSIFKKIKEYFIQYFNKWKGYDKSPKRPDLEEIGWSWLSSFIGILVLALLHYRVLIDNEMLMLIGSFAASAVLIFAAPKSPLAQPRNLIFGHLFSSIIGITIRVALVYTNANFEVACALSVSLSIAFMQFTTTLHPPGGATALIAVMSAEQRWRGYYYCLVPVTSGAIIMLITALIINNFARKRSYPVFW